MFDYTGIVGKSSNKHVHDPLTQEQSLLWGAFIHVSITVFTVTHTFKWHT